VLIFLIKGLSFTAGALIILSFTQMLSLFINIFIFSILARVILSWINPGNYNAATSILYSLTEPMLHTVRKMVPPISGIDLSPLLVLIGLQMAKMMALPPLHQAIALLS
ncbi:MAG: YggT family protein, partial [Pseudomonadota bacterium]